MNYDTVIFDNDGVLVGRTRFGALRTAAENTFAEFDVTDPDPEHTEAMAVAATPEQVTTISEAYDIDPDEFWTVRDRVGTEVQQQEVMAGRKSPYDDLGVLRDLDVAKGVVSSNQQATVDFLLEHYGVDDLFGAAYGREPTVESLDRLKPNPHYIEQALADLDAESALFVGDNESDVRAAENAGIDSAFIRRPHRRDWGLETWPTWEIDSLDDLHSVVG